MKLVFGLFLIESEFKSYTSLFYEPWGLLPGLLASFVVDIHHHLFGTLTKVGMYMYMLIGF